MPRFALLLCLLQLLLTGCGQDLHFKIRYDDVGSLAVGDPVVLDGKKIGEVAGIEPTGAGGHLVEVAIPRQSAGAATSEAGFILDFDPDNQQKRQIEIVLSSPGGKPIADGAVVKGSYPGPLGSFPLGEIFREFGGALRDLRGQVERFRQEFRKLPDSPESKKLLEEWRRLADEIAKAQSEAGSTLKNDILPKLEQEMKELGKRLEELEKSAPADGRAREI